MGAHTFHEKKLLGALAILSRLEFMKFVRDTGHNIGFDGDLWNSFGISEMAGIYIGFLGVIGLMAFVTGFLGSLGFKLDSCDLFNFHGFHGICPVFMG